MRLLKNSLSLVIHGRDAGVDKANVQGGLGEPKRKGSRVKRAARRTSNELIPRAQWEPTTQTPPAARLLKRKTSTCVRR